MLHAKPSNILWRGIRVARKKNGGAILARVVNVLIKKKPGLAFLYRNIKSNLSGTLAAAKLQCIRRGSIHV
jgi:hypothetical protein